MKDIRQSKEYANYLDRLGWQIEKIDGVYCFVRKIPLLGYFIKIQRPEKISEKIITALEQKYHPFQIILEPNGKTQEAGIKNQGFKQSKSPYLPSKTLECDLTKSEKELFQALKKDCRYALSKTKDLKLKTENNLTLFRDLWKHSVPFNRFVPSPRDLLTLKKSFGKKALFLIEEHQNAGAIFLIGNSTAYYWQAFTNKKGRKNYSQYKIVWQGILWAKKHSAKIFDFEGIYDERFPNKHWLGFTHFKKSFGGLEVVYPGALVKKRRAHLFL